MNCRRIIILFLIVIILLPVCVAENRSEREERFFSEITSQYRGAKGIERGIEEHLGRLSWECLDIEVTKMIADNISAASEVAIHTNDSSAELRVWEQPESKPLSSLKGESDHVVYYIDSQFSDGTDAWDKYHYKDEIRFIIYQHNESPVQEVLNKSIIVRIAKVKGKQKEIKELALSVVYKLRPGFEEAVYDLNREPLIDEIRITKLEIRYTILQVYHEFEYEPMTDEYRAVLDYEKPRIGIPDPLTMKIYQKNQLVKVVEFRSRGGELIPWRYWTATSFD